MKTKIHLVDDDVSLCQEMTKFLGNEGFDITTDYTITAARENIKANQPDILLLDLKLPDGIGLDFLDEVKSTNPEIPVIMLSGYGTIAAAVEAMKKGAENFLTKPVDPDHLLIHLKRIVEHKHLHNLLIIQDLELADKRKMVIGKSERMKELIKTCQTSAKSDATILITGETGTGKHLIAHYIHQNSNRSQYPFVYVNCATFTENLLESDLFGHEKGAFTGAIKQKRGRMELANQGTLFLDEIGEIPLPLQAKLLHFIEYGEFQRVGGTQTLRSNTRIVCATNRDLSEELKTGRFREDLFYRVNVIQIQVPPLRERREDIPIYIDYFLEKYSLDISKMRCELNEKLAEKLKNYPWPGNIRELQNAIERAVVLCPTHKLQEKDFPFLASPAEIVSEGIFSPRPWNQAQIEFKKEYLKKILEQTNGNQTQAAKILKIQRSFLNRMIKEMEIHKG